MGQDPGYARGEALLCPINRRQGLIEMQGRFFHQ